MAAGYAVKEIFHTLQGEGLRAGRAAVFCRFAGCNLWSGREADRADAVCRFCDTEFVGTDGTLGGKYDSAGALAAVVAAQWPAGEGNRYVVLTGGEPLLQVDAALIDALHAERFEIAIETNGTLAAPPGIDWICVSPKAGAAFVQRRGDELKLVYPQPALLPAAVEAMPGLEFGHWLLQAMDGPDRDAHQRAAIEHCRAHPRWRLSVQTHKVIGIR
ncbi:MAG: 7-carboxy-7-deazaguanine synthase [Burkholderiales bacterium]|nr:7-carboxy-7-deazaguanine synthase [Burkholderiales bacterium]